MALVLLCGQPCSGKSTAAECLKKALVAEPSFSSSVRIIDEPCLHLERNVSYADMPSEKNLRGVLRSEVDRSVSKDSILIVDSLNNIKGYRYELWCLARAAGIRYCVLYCDTEESYVRAWNEARRERGGASYDDKILDDLIRRFEKPDGRNRWDSPLFELKPSHEQIQESSPVILDAVSFLTKRVDPKSRDVRVLQPTIATQNMRTSQTNSLYELDCATQDVINAIINSQSEGYGDNINCIDLGEGLPKISFFLFSFFFFSLFLKECLQLLWTYVVYIHGTAYFLRWRSLIKTHINVNRSARLPELRRLRRTFMKLAGQSSLSGPPPPTDAQSAKRLFIDYLNRELSAE